MSLPPTDGKGCRLGIGSAGGTGDFPVPPVIFIGAHKNFYGFDMYTCIRALIGADFSLETIK
jgi:hypothetical protein